MEKVNNIQHGTYTLEQLIKIWKPYFYTMTTNFTTNSTLKEDLYAECLVSLWQSNETYDSTKGATFYTYVATQAKYAMLNYLNQKNTTSQTIYTPTRYKDEFQTSITSIDASENDFKALSETLADEMVEEYQNEKIKPLKANMELLKKTHRDIMTVKYEGYSDTDIAYILGVSKQRVGQVVDKSIKRLQKAFNIPEVGVQCNKHTALPTKERRLRIKHKIN